MAEKKVKVRRGEVRGGFEVAGPTPKKYVKYDGVGRPSWHKYGAKGEYKELDEIIPELAPQKSKSRG